MPARSRRQQRALYAKFGRAWVKAHHFDTVRPKRTARKRK